MKYLVMRCDPLGDQWECDADRTPITLTDNWEQWFKDTNPDYYFEVFEFTNDSFTCVKEYEDTVEEGMCFAFYPNGEDEKPVVITKFPNYTRHNPVPDEVIERYTVGDDLDNELISSGYIAWLEDDILYSYSEYEDNIISSCY